jgi:hypothetical protein
MQEYGWKAGDRLDITSHFQAEGKGELRKAPRFLVVPRQIPRRLCGQVFSRSECAGADRQRGLEQQYSDVEGDGDEGGAFAPARIPHDACKKSREEKKE